MSTRFYDTMTGLAPLHWWRFHSANAATESDIGSDPDSPFNGSAGTVTSQASGPLDVAQTSYSVQLASGAHLVRQEDWGSNDFAGTSDGSIVFFFKVASGSTQRYMLGNHPPNRLFAVYMLPSGAIRVGFIQNANARSLSTDTSGYDDDTWHMFALTGDGTNPHHIYIDGDEVTYSTSTAGTGLTDHEWLGVCAPYYDPFWLGEDAYVTVGAIPGCPGYYSELAFFSYPLSASEVYSLWAASQAEAPPSPGEGGHRYKGRKTFVGF